MARLLILTPAELTRDPRARRAASAAAADGWDVWGLCPASGGEPVELPSVTVVRVGGDAVSARLRAAGLGGGRRDGPVLREARGLFRLVRLLRLTVALVRRARAAGAVDVVHGNDFDTLPAAAVIARRNRARLVYDAHELYVEQEADAPRIHRAVAGAIERALARRADAVVTVNGPIALELARRFRLRTAPIVVHNFPALTEAAPAGTPTPPLRVVYQGALGHGRHLDDLLDAAAATGDDVRVTLRVVGVPADELRRRANGRVEVLDPVPPDGLVEALAPFDVGIVVTRPLTRNDELATPNKLFEYLMAGLAVAVPRLPGVGPLVEEAEVGVTYTPGDPQDLARVLVELARDSARVQTLRANARAAALERYNAEAERPALAAAWGAR